MAKKKSAQTELDSWGDVDAAMRRMGELQNSVTELEVSMNRQLAAIRERSDADTQPLLEELKDIEADIKKFVRKHRSDLEGKSKKLNFGRTGYRQSTNLVIPKNIDIIAELRRHGLEDCINVKETPNRDLLRSKPEEDIKRVGAYLSSKDTFFCEVDREKIKPTV